MDFSLVLSRIVTASVGEVGTKVFTFDATPEGPPRAFVELFVGSLSPSIETLEEDLGILRFDAHLPTVKDGTLQQFAITTDILPVDALQNMRNEVACPNSPIRSAWAARGRHNWALSRAQVRAGGEMIGGKAD